MCHAGPGAGRTAGHRTRLRCGAQIAGGSAEAGRLVSSLLRDLDDSARGLLAGASVLGTDLGATLTAEVCTTSQEF